MAQCVRSLKLIPDELNALQEFLKIRPDTNLFNEIQERIGDTLAAQNQHQEARNAYLSITESGSVNANTFIWMKIAETYSAEKDYTNAIQTWLNVFDNTTDDSQKAKIDYLLAQAYLDLNSPQQAYARYQDAINNFPRYYDSYASLLALINAKQPVNEFQRGLVNYYRNQYALAQEAFYRFMENEPGHDGSAWYYIGLCQMFLADYESALSSFSRLIETFPDNRFYASSWDEKSYIEWFYLENFMTGAQTLIDYAKKHPDQPDAPKFLFEAGRILERGNRLSDAANQWDRLIDEYPLYANSQEALFYAGISRYRAKNYDSSLATFNRLLLVSSKPADLARAHFWIAKVYEKKGETASAAKNFELAAEDSPTDFYTERAKDILADRGPFDFSDDFSFQADLEQSEAVADQWVRLTFSLSNEVDLGLLEELNLDLDFRKANELWELGEKHVALNIFDQVRLKYEQDALSSYRLLKHLTAINAWRPAVYTSRQVLTLAGLIEDARTLSAPNYFNLIRYGAWFNNTVLTAHRDYGVHPFILYGLMRQESMFDPWISSGAGARGLMQIMPATGAELAKKLRWPPNYSEADLLRAIVAINLSGSYLSTQYQYFNENDFFMLASYNAGPGNTANWVALAEDDADLFVELIRFEETRTYIRHVYEFAKMYERFYGNP